MHIYRFISVFFSFSAIAAVFLFGFLGCDKSSVPYNEEAAIYSKFDGRVAFTHVETMVGFGPRPSGSDALEKNRVYIIAELVKAGWVTERQTFSKLTPEGNIEFTNIRARFAGTAWEDQVTGLVCSHYDTKKFGFEFVGANDAGSSTGVLIEMAQVLKGKPELAKQIELVFFDGEEAFGTRITDTDGLYGSREYAVRMLQTPEKKRPEWGVLLDMVGDKDLNIRAAMQIPNASIRDLQKAEESGNTVDMEKVKAKLGVMSKQLIQAASDLDVRSHVGISSDFITDDHVPLNRRAGIPTIDLIDFDYGNNWHTPGDTLDKISADSLAISGRVTLLFIEKYLAQ